MAKKINEWSLSTMNFEQICPTLGIGICNRTIEVYHGVVNSEIVYFLENLRSHLLFLKQTLKEEQLQFICNVLPLKTKVEKFTRYKCIIE